MEDREIKEQYKAVTEFENEIAKFCGSKYVVAVDCCTNAIFLCLEYFAGYEITIPSRTYIGVYFSAKNCGYDIKFRDIEWEKMYRIEDTPIYDAACYFEKDMYIPNTLMCLSFSYKKRLPIGRGGAILTDDEEFKNWCVSSRNLGKDITKNLFEQVYIHDGWNMLFHPDLARKGLGLLKKLPDSQIVTYKDYPDIRTQMKY